MVNFTAAEAKGALARIEEGGGDVIIADYSLPDLDGLTLLEKAAELEPDTPRILMTASTEVNITREAINHAHVANFFSKPFKPQEVIETVWKSLDDHWEKVQKAHQDSQALRTPDDDAERPSYSTL